MIRPSEFVINNYTKEFCVFSTCNIHIANGYIAKVMFYSCAVKHHVVCLFNVYCQFIGFEPNIYSFLFIVDYVDYLVIICTLYENTGVICE